MSHFDKEKDARYFNVKVRNPHFELVDIARRSKYYEEVPRTTDVVNEAIEHFFKTKISKHIAQRDIPQFSDAANERNYRLGKGTKRPQPQVA